MRRLLHDRYLPMLGAIIPDNVQALIATEVEAARRQRLKSRRKEVVSNGGYQPQLPGHLTQQSEQTKQQLDPDDHRALHSKDVFTINCSAMYPYGSSLPVELIHMVVWAARQPPELSNNAGQAVQLQTACRDCLDVLAGPSAPTSSTPTPTASGGAEARADRIAWAAQRVSAVAMYGTGVHGDLFTIVPGADRGRADSGSVAVWRRSPTQHRSATRLSLLSVTSASGRHQVDSNSARPAACYHLLRTFHGTLPGRADVWFPRLREVPELSTPHRTTYYADCVVVTSTDERCEAGSLMLGDVVKMRAVKQPLPVSGQFDPARGEAEQADSSTTASSVSDDRRADGSHTFAGALIYVSLHDDFTLIPAWMDGLERGRVCAAEPVSPRALGKQIFTWCENRRLRRHDDGLTELRSQLDSAAVQPARATAAAATIQPPLPLLTPLSAPGPEAAAGGQPEARASPSPTQPSPRSGVSPPAPPSLQLNQQLDPVADSPRPASNSGDRPLAAAATTSDAPVLLSPSLDSSPATVSNEPPAPSCSGQGSAQRGGLSDHSPVTASAPAMGAPPRPSLVQSSPPASAAAAEAAAFSSIELDVDVACSPPLPAGRRRTRSAALHRVDPAPADHLPQHGAAPGVGDESEQHRQQNASSAYSTTATQAASRRSTQRRTSTAAESAVIAQVVDDDDGGSIARFYKAHRVEIRDWLNDAAMTDLPTAGEASVVTAFRAYHQQWLKHLDAQPGGRPLTVRDRAVPRKPSYSALTKFYLASVGRDDAEVRKQWALVLNSGARPRGSKRPTKPMPMPWEQYTLPTVQRAVPMRQQQQQQHQQQPTRQRQRQQPRRQQRQEQEIEEEQEEEPEQKADSTASSSASSESEQVITKKAAASSTATRRGRGRRQATRASDDADDSKQQSAPRVNQPRISKKQAAAAAARAAAAAKPTLATAVREPAPTDGRRKTRQSADGADSDDSRAVIVDNHLIQPDSSGSASDVEQGKRRATRAISVAAAAKRRRRGSAEQCPVPAQQPQQQPQQQQQQQLLQAAARTISPPSPLATYRLDSPSAGRGQQPAPSLAAAAEANPDLDQRFRQMEQKLLHSQQQWQLQQHQLQQLQQQQVMQLQPKRATSPQAEQSAAAAHQLPLQGISEPAAGLAASAAAAPAAAATAVLHPSSTQAAHSAVTAQPPPQLQLQQQSAASPSRSPSPASRPSAFSLVPRRGDDEQLAIGPPAQRLQQQQQQYGQQQYEQQQQYHQQWQHQQQPQQQQPHPYVMVQETRHVYERGQQLQPWTPAVGSAGGGNMPVFVQAPQPSTAQQQLLQYVPQQQLAAHWQSRAAAAGMGPAAALVNPPVITTDHFQLISSAAQHNEQKIRAQQAQREKEQEAEHAQRQKERETVQAQRKAEREAMEERVARENRRVMDAGLAIITPAAGHYQHNGMATDPAWHHAGYVGQAPAGAAATYLHGVGPPFSGSGHGMAAAHSLADMTGFPPGHGYSYAM